MKKFETFVTDNNRDSAAIDFVPKHNPVVNQNAQLYVDEILQNGDLNLLFRAVGVTAPKNIDSIDMDEVYDTIRQKAIDYYIQNPEAIGKDIPMKQFKVQAGDGIPRTNNIGGALHVNSPRIGENKINFDKEIEISSDDMRYFNEEEPLIELIRNGKIMLANNKIYCNNKDKQTIEVLDIYFEIEGKNALEESLDFLKYSDTKEKSFLYIGKLNHRFDLEVVDNVDNLVDIIDKSGEAFLFTTFEDITIDKLSRIAKIIFENSTIKFLLNVYEMPLESSEVLGLNEGRYQVLTLKITTPYYRITLNLIKSVENYILVSIENIEKLIISPKNNITNWESTDLKNFKKNMSFLCDTKFEFEGWKELLTEINKNL